MTREESLKQLEFILSDTRDGQIIELTDYSREAIQTVVDILSQEPCEDCISRKTLRELVYFVQSIKAEHNENGYPINYGTICDILIKGYELLKTSSVQPTRIHAKWKYADAYNYRCSKCKHVSPWDYAYCPYCGAKIEGEEVDGE